MIHDISRPISESMPVYPGDPEVALETVSDLSSGAGYSLTKIVMGSHTGTHVDAPSHILAGGNTVDGIAMDSLMGPCYVAHCNSDMEISIRDLEDMAMPSSTARLLIRSRDAIGYLSPAVASRLVEAGVRLVGVDSPSVDAPAFPTSKGLAVHRTLLEAGVVIVENLALDDIEPGHYWLACLPLRIEGCDGAPARAVLMDSAPNPHEGAWRG